MPAVLDAALAYRSRGWTPIPLQPRSKVPAVAWGGFRTSRPRVDFLRKHLSVRDANLGIVMGRASGNLVAVDIDPRNGGDRSIRGLTLPPTWISRTGGDGWHLVYATETPLPKRAAALPGVDLIGDGGFIVAPPSRHPSGGRYRLEIDEEPAPAPDWVLELLRGPATPPAQTPETWSATIGEGERNDRLFRAACGFAEGRCFACGGRRCRQPDERHLLKRLLALNAKRCRPPLVAADVLVIAKSAWRISARGRAPQAPPQRQHPRHGRNLVPDGEIR